ncbi:hypothetical protein BH11PLA1_BH11PLA1_13490 [soil metagenome]
MPTTQTPPTSAPALHARGILAALVPASATKPAYAVITIPGSSYALHLLPLGDAGALAGRIGARVTGTIECSARRVDLVGAGGRYVEPVLGRPRRVQGSIIAIDAAANTLILNAGGATVVDGLPLPIRVKLTDARQQAAQFALGACVSMDVLDGATFTLAP